MKKWWACLLLGGVLLGSQDSSMPGQDGRAQLLAELTNLEKHLDNGNNIWLKKFNNVESYDQIYTEIQSIQTQLKALKHKKKQ
ncbi:hypothetical protein [Helicobacter labacensis]|uniref:hypothetical protein n=1 Tax=Helicobacter labacensis TaxID=2316079 RepID=UPI001F230898|nr:hypothetical protein [Helicobacter labacensis]